MFFFFLPSYAAIAVKVHRGNTILRVTVPFQREIQPHQKGKWRLKPKSSSKLYFYRDESPGVFFGAGQTVEKTSILWLMFCGPFLTIFSL